MVINVYVIDYAPKHDEKTHVAAFYEVPTSHPDLPGVGPVPGSLDHMIALQIVLQSPKITSVVVRYGSLENVNV